MLFKTHIAFSFLIGLYLIDFLKIKSQILFMLILLFFSVFPDIDNPSSRTFKRLKPFSYPAALLGHRNILHTVYFPAAVALTLFVLNLKLLSLAALAGYSLHLILDMLTKKGISPLYPLTKKRIRGFIRVGSITEKIIFILLVVLIIYKLVSI
ncbi:metal-dependent hydrolase [Candidatus Woesearchaeota archaeon]|nr:metal-dependent hydrolase [Candidatus Woesearchaeota archaeon]